MTTEQTAELAAACHRALESLHAMIYFAPEAEQRLTAAGLRPGRMCYFASRSAAMGAVGAGVVAATFYNFNPELVARHIPRAWTLASPGAVSAARLEAADGALRRLLGDDVVTSDDVAEAAKLARLATEGCAPDGRPLYAAHAELEWPSEPHLALWHAITLLREHRGDGHIAALVANGLSGIGALVTHTATGNGFLVAAAKATRGWSDEQWSATERQLRQQDLLDDAGNLTESGAARRGQVEAVTNAAAAAPWAHLGAEKAARLREIGKALSRQASAAGAFPAGIFANRR
ncbi:MAG: SCO6745 family protein [Sciscionella sp.]